MDNETLDGTLTASHIIEPAEEYHWIRLIDNMRVRPKEKIEEREKVNIIEQLEALQYAWRNQFERK